MFEVRFIPKTIFDRNVGVRQMEKNRDACSIDGKIFSHTFATEKPTGEIVLHGSCSCFVPDKIDAHFLAFEIETRIACRVSVEASPWLM